MKRRFLTTLLSAVMALSMLFGTGIMTQAAETDTEYVSLPVTIRDYAADGMLFQWNELGATGDYVKTIQSGSTTWQDTQYNYYAVNPSSWGANNYNGIRICTKGNTAWKAASLNWHCIVCNSDGTIAKVVGKGTSKSGLDSSVPSGGYSVWAYEGDTTNYNILSAITESNMADYKVTYNTSTKKITISHKTTTESVTETYHHGSTKGYGLLQTDAKDHFNDLANSTAISGTTLTQNGTWNSPDVTTSDTMLNSGAKQTLYGCYVRTDLVEPKLGDNGKPVYTEATVTYLANYMQKTLPEVWKNNDGTYNMWYVMGTKLFDDYNNYVGPVTSATKDLASVLRSTITGGLGSYAATKAKTPNQVKDCTTYFDAAYFLLHNTFSDNIGYGQTVNEYHTINLVKKTVDGKTYYVYNSAYDGTDYDTTNGVISNSQTDTITTREGTTYVRGNLQPESCFDPIGNAYYGKNGDAYAKAVGDTGGDKYYNNTNYNLTLEGHAQFIYYEDDNLYFNFTGDDDVYLYINGTRVLDMGGAHAISKCGIYLNDVATLCGLKDGEVYDFDFYYMERHGTAANFGIETNIKIVDPSMLTEKTAYQDGQNVGYNGFVNPNKPVTYAFKLTNNGEAQIQNLTFEDDDIGVSLTKDSITLNNETTINNLVVYVLNPDGSNKIHYTTGQVTDENLKKVLADGLLVGESIAIYGFNYTIPNAKWVDNKFPNTVYTTAISTGENASHKNLNGVASCQVQKQTYQYVPMHYYEWVGHGVTATTAELIEPVTKVVNNSGITVNNAVIQLCSASGQNSEAGINSNAEVITTVDETGVTKQEIKYTGSVTGADTYYYKVNGYGPIAVTVYSYDVADNVYVLDYSLPVELNGPDFGLRVNDTVKLAANPFTTTDETIGITQTSETYGDFTWKDPSLKYTMKEFMNGTDEVTVTVQVREDGATGVTTKTGVIMTEKVTVAPANVVYYEDDFPGITYVNEGDNDWAYYQSSDSQGNEQSADQDMPYGQDPNYQEDKNTKYTEFVPNTNDLDTFAEDTIDYLNDYLSGGDASNGTIHELVVESTEEVMNFGFRGTGFEIISRTTQDEYAVVSVKVARKNNDNTYTVVKQFPVITESKGGDLYQIPIISVTGLTRAEYKVTLTAAGSTNTKTRVLYIDGIRIYEPLDDVDELMYYNPDEVKAEFLEVKGLIQNQRAIYADISTADDDVTKLVTGTTLIEDTNESGYVLTTIEGDVDQYMSAGPNNEIYLNGTNASGIIAFFIYPDEEVAANARTLEIGAHRKSDSYTGENDSVNLVYGSTPEAIVDGTNFYTVNSGTEQYYEIDVRNLVKDEANNRYLVMIGTNDCETYSTLSLTNIKVSGYQLGYGGAATVSAVSEGTADSDPVLTQVKTIQIKLKAVSQTAEPEEPAATEPAATEPAATEPAATEPAATEPAATEPAATEPAATEPATTEPAATEPVATEPAATEPETSQPVPEETEPEVPTVNENLQIQSATLRAAKVVSGKSATIAVKASKEAVTFAVYDADGNPVELAKVVSKPSNGIMTFQAMWTVTGGRGDELTYTVVVYDADGLASANTMEVTVTIK